MRKRNASVKELGCILLVVAILIVGNSSVIFGGLLNNTPPKFISNIGKVKLGMTKSEVKHLLGTPSSTSNTMGTDNTISESWSYGEVYDDIHNNLIKDTVVNQAVGSGIGMVISQLPLSALLGFGGHVTATGAGIAHQVATDAINPEQINYYATVSFVNGVVTSKSYNAPGGITTRPETQVSGNGTSPIPKHNTTGSQISHESTTIVYGPAPFFVKDSICHKPDCAHIRGIEKQTLQRFATLELALQAENKKCDSCIKPEGTDETISTTSNSTQDMHNSNKAKAKND